MLETSRKGYWQPDQQVLDTLAAQYATSVVQKEIACCDHTCNNPMLNQMVVSIISISGVLSPELVAQFKLAVEKMAQKTIQDQVEQRQKLLYQLAAPQENTSPPDPSKAETGDSSD